MGRKFVVCFVFFLVFVVLSGCRNPVLPDTGGDEKSDPVVENRAPVASFGSWDYEVRNAEITSVDQNFSESGTSALRAMYEGDGNTRYYLFAFYDSAFLWGLHTAHSELVTRNELTFYNVSSSDLPPESGWLFSSDDSSSDLRVIQIPINGHGSTYGYEVEAFYIFSDPDGDKEGLSQYQWFRCETPTDEGVPISGANSLTYTTEEEDNLKYLRFEVTPVDELGNQGVSVKSEASNMIGST